MKTLKAQVEKHLKENLTNDSGSDLSAYVCCMSKSILLKSTRWLKTSQQDVQTAFDWAQFVTIGEVSTKIPFKIPLVQRIDLENLVNTSQSLSA